MRSVFFGALFVWLYIITDVYGGYLEGQIAPVVIDVEITRTERVDDASTRIWGVFTRARDCDFRNIQFFLGNRERSSSAAIAIEEGSKARGSGVHDFGPWVVQLTALQLESNSYSVATHSCHPFWETKSEFH